MREPIAIKGTSSINGIHHAPTTVEDYTPEEIADIQRRMAGQLVDLYGLEWDETDKKLIIDDDAFVEIQSILQALGIGHRQRPALVIAQPTRPRPPVQASRADRAPESEYQSLVERGIIERSRAAKDRHKQHKICDNCSRCACHATVKSVQHGLCNECRPE